MLHLRVHASATCLNGFHLSLAEGQTTETGGELGTVEELAVPRADGAKGVAGGTTDAAGVERGATERTVLLGLCAVGGEGVGESSNWRGGVNARSVVDGLRDRALADEADQRGAGSIAESEGGTHCDGVLVKFGVGVVEKKVNFTGACAKFYGSGSIRTDLEMAEGELGN